MKRSCSYCGGIHERSHVCSSKPKKQKEVTYIDRFRRARAWRNKSLYIRERDNNLCQICLRLRYNTTQQYTFDGIEVHHIEPVVSAWDRRLDDSNLITLCREHHEQAEDGTIPQYELEAIAYENNEKYKL
ncbi:HNH endonuclease [Lysinibacillus sp. CD3-6]|uniref:HNH endonuclease n=1 Tax=Lysinibacillus sp. CD3-6 TaxID=2892541 RepID=UPI001122BA29|nr:HNH endonuclease [Lysinibacillus sp. CD3-6]